MGGYCSNTRKNHINQAIKISNMEDLKKTISFYFLRAKSARLEFVGRTSPWDIVNAYF